MEGGECLGLEWKGQGGLHNPPRFIQTLQANLDRRPSKMTENQGPNGVLGPSQRHGIYDQGLLHVVVGKLCC